MVNTYKTTNYNRLLNGLKHLDETAQKNNWEFYYDFELDNLYYTSLPVPKKSRLISVNDEISYYVTSDAHIAGVFIQYWKNNFLQHRREYRKMLDLFRKDTGTIKKTAIKTGTIKIYRDAFILHLLQNAPSIIK